MRSEADSNRCTRFCRPLPSHSAIRPFLRSVSQSECKGRNILLISKIFCKIISIIAQIARLYRIILSPTPRFLSLFSASYLSSSLLALACSLPRRHPYRHPSIAMSRLRCGRAIHTSYILCARGIVVKFAYYIFFLYLCHHRMDLLQ